MNQKVVIALLVLIILAGGAWMLWGKKPQQAGVVMQPQATSTTATTTGATPTQATSTELSQGSLQGELSGTWKSTEDPKFTRTFTADGKVTDSYAGDASATDTGTYSIVNPAQEKDLPVPAASLTGMSVVKTDFKKTGVMYFSIVSLTNSSLSMGNLSGRGNTLSFVRVK